MIGLGGFSAAGTRATSNACMAISLFRRNREFPEENREKQFSEQGIFRRVQGKQFQQRILCLMLAALHFVCRSNTRFKNVGIHLNDFDAFSLN
jgi:hypothetical protein